MLEIPQKKKLSCQTYRITSLFMQQNDGHPRNVVVDNSAKKQAQIMIAGPCEAYNSTKNSSDAAQTFH
jgi:hypothetical protein